jgi:hypothetical protein
LERIGNPQILQPDFEQGEYRFQFAVESISNVPMAAQKNLKDVAELPDEGVRPTSG